MDDQPSPSWYEDLSVKVALITMVCNEKEWLPIWLRYYSKFISNENIFILDNDTTDGSTHSLPTNVIKVSSGKAFDHWWMMDKTNELLDSLLAQGFDFIIRADADEFIVPVSLDLNSYLEKLPSNSVIKPRGYEVMHVPTYESDSVDWSKPILKQRNFGYWSEEFSKPSIVGCAGLWGIGFHTFNPLDPNNRTTETSDSVIIHTHKIDYAYCLEKHIGKANRPNWDERSIREKAGWQNYLKTKQEIDSWYFSHPYSKIEFPENILGAI